MSLGRAPARTFQDLVVWQKAHQFVLKAYELSADFPKTPSLLQQLAEVSKILDAYGKAILASDS